MKINLIAAVSANGVLGNRRTNDLPWGKDKYPEDLKHFRKMTAGENSVVIMGSATMRSIGRSLPKRRNIVISRTPDAFNQAETGIETYTSLVEAIEHCREDESVWIIGGGIIYQQAISLVDRLYITVIPEQITSSDPTDLVYFPFLNDNDYILEETLTLSGSKQLFCYVYNRDSWLAEELTSEDERCVSASQESFIQSIDHQPVKEI